MASHLFLNVTHIKSSFSKNGENISTATVECIIWAPGTAGIYFYFLLLYRRFKLKEISLFDITNHMYVRSITIYHLHMENDNIFALSVYTISALVKYDIMRMEKNVADIVQSHMTEKMHLFVVEKVKIII